MGACVNAPMICVADYTKGVDGFSYIYYEDLSPKDAVAILEDLKAGKAPRVNSESTPSNPSQYVYYASLISVLKEHCISGHTLCKCILLAF